MKKAPVVITSIFPPNDVIKAYVKLGHEVIVAGDKKSPSDWFEEGCSFISFEEQLNLFPVMAKLVAPNHYARKNMAYLVAMQKSKTILETDDDNMPYDFYPNFVREEIEVDTYFSTSRYINIFQLMQGRNTKIWPRGYPLPLINDLSPVYKTKVKKKFPVQHSLINHDTDVDAIYRLTNNSYIEFEPNKIFSLSPHTYTPINTQNTFWNKEAFLLMYIPSTVASRVCDIYRGYIAQRLLWELGFNLLILSPSVSQNRNPHDYLKDLAEEVPLYTTIHYFINALEEVTLHGSIEDKLVQIYEALILKGLIRQEELPILKEWISQVTKLTA